MVRVEYQIVYNELFQPIECLRIERINHPTIKDPVEVNKLHPDMSKEDILQYIQSWKDKTSNEVS